MSQSTLDPNLAPEGPASEPNATRQGNAPHRRRRSASHKTQPPHTEQATTTATAPAAEPVPTAEATASAPEAASPASTPPEASEQPRARTSGRSRRRTSGGRKNDVQLVIPPSANGESADSETSMAAAPGAESAPETPETQTPTAADVRVVSVTSELAEPGIPLASEPAGAVATPTEAPSAESAAPAAEAPNAPSAAPRRYRFDRKATAAPYAPASRPERLSGPLMTAPPAPPASEPAAEANEAAEARPAFPSTAFAPDVPEEEAAVSSDAIDDIVSALGLRDAAPRREPLRLPIETTAPATEEPEAESETETPSETESAAAGTDTATAGTGRSKRPRRRRRGGSHAASAGEEDAEEMLATEPLAEPAPRTREPRRPAASAPTPITEPGRAERNGYEQYAPPEYGSELESPYAPYGQAERQPWDITHGQTQIGQTESPFVSPDPSVVRGFGPQPRGVAGPARETFARTGRTERTDTPPMSSNQLANMVTHAIQQQTDRLLNEFRYHPQSPGMTVMFPAFPSTERVGIFVDVANLHYSSRNLRISVDFGKLLDFLRGNRRMIRAHAYAPTNPDPRADQSFLDAVKGLGYRITTKNYKTFASGAKKADMDLDLCMDIVRMVDANAVDTIVLVSGDSDFLPLLEYCSDHGVRVEVAAFEDAAAAILRQSCDLFINLSLVNDIRM